MNKHSYNVNPPAPAVRPPTPPGPPKIGMPGPITMLDPDPLVLPSHYETILHDDFAKIALAGLLGNENVLLDSAAIADLAYHIADEMMAMRARSRS